MPTVHIERDRDGNFRATFPSKYGKTMECEITNVQLNFINKVERDKLYVQRILGDAYQDTNTRHRNST